ncbi:unnamed protein product [Didymodactylos carnosus]|uniref:Uncharacterized protein n=1 Tax=Didymodactylos carnosus TaxID=1234261 RepID=A0A8S2ZD27_9BILA|nr:unnamed protein product [Didymodactylos carnosus]
MYAQKMCPSDNEISNQAAASSNAYGLTSSSAVTEPALNTVLNQITNFRQDCESDNEIQFHDQNLFSQRSTTVPANMEQDFHLIGIHV